MTSVNLPSAHEKDRTSLGGTFPMRPTGYTPKRASTVLLESVRLVTIYGQVTRYGRSPLAYDSRSGLADQFFKQCPVMNHRLTQVFRVGLPLRLPKGDFVSRSVIFHNQWMIDGDIRRSLLKVTARGHHISHFTDPLPSPHPRDRRRNAPGLRAMIPRNAYDRRRLAAADGTPRLVQRAL